VHKQGCTSLDLYKSRLVSGRYGRLGVRRVDIDDTARAYTDDRRQVIASFLKRRRSATPGGQSQIIHKTLNRNESPDRVHLPLLGPHRG
jgi:hypothetical protein